MFYYRYVSFLLGNIYSTAKWRKVVIITPLFSSYGNYGLHKGQDSGEHITVAAPLLPSKNHRALASVAQWLEIQTQSQTLKHALSHFTALAPFKI